MITPVDWAAVENAIHAWVAAGSGLAAGKVIWDDQGGPRPSVPFIALHREGPATKGLGVETRISPYTGGGPYPAVDVDAIAQKEFDLSVTAFTGPVTSGGSATALLDPVELNSHSQTQFLLFSQAGICCFDRGPVQNLSQVVETVFEGRALLRVRFRLVSGLNEQLGWIQTVGVVGTFQT